jgi:hypothetical protein
MTPYEKSLTVLEGLFARDCQFSLATCADGAPSVRVVDTYYKDSALWVVTYAKSRKVREIEGNPNVALCGGLYSFTGKARNAGHPLREELAEIRAELVRAFAPWYFRHNDESDAHMCYVKIDLEAGFFYKDGTGYRVNFVEKTCEEFPFESDVTVIG